jgi:protease I
MIRKNEAGRLQGKKIAVLAADGFEYVELQGPAKALELAGAELEILSLHPGRIRGMNLTAPTRTVRVDRTIDEASPSDYDALFIPGGFVGPDFLRQSAAARMFVRDVDAAGKPIATLCHGPWLLASAELVEGRKLSAWPGLRDDIVHAGGVWRDEPVVRDANWVSSRGPQDLAELIPAMIDLFAKGEGFEETESASADESSPKPERPIPLALRAARFIPGPTMRAVLATLGILGVGAGMFALRQQLA